MEQIKNKVRELFSAVICNYVLFLESKAWFIVGLTVFLSLQLGSGVRFWTNQQSDDIEYLFAPNDGRFVIDRQSSFDIWPLDPENFFPGRTFDLLKAPGMIIRLKNNSDLLNAEFLDNIYDWNEYLMHDMLAYDRNRINASYTFQDICFRRNRRCAFTNNHLFLLRYAVRRNETEKLTFPRWEILRGGSPFYVGNLIGGVDLNASSGHINKIRAVLLLYYLRLDASLLDKVQDWESAFERNINSRFINNSTSIFDVAYYHSRSFKFGLDQYAVLVGSPIVVYTIAILGAVTQILCTNLENTDERWKVDFVNSKLLLGLCGLLIAVLANVTAVGVWGYCGGIFNGFLQTTPLLSVAVALDDMFIMMRSWMYSDNSQPVNTRMESALKYSIHSITITSVTSCLSFLVGSSSNFNGIKLYCYVMAMIMALDYLYVITMYTSCMYLSAVIEHQGLCNTTLYFLQPSVDEGTFGLMINGYKKINSLPLQLCTSATSTISSRNGIHTSYLSHRFKNSKAISNQLLVDSGCKEIVKSKSVIGESDRSCSNEAAIKTKAEDYASKDPLAAFIYHYYSKYLINTNVRFAILALYVLYIVFAIWGLSTINIGASTSKIISPNYHLHKFNSLQNDDMFDKGQQIEIIVHNPPDYSKLSIRNEMHDMVSCLEDTELTMSSDATDFFLRDFENFLNETNSSTEDNLNTWEATLFSWSTLNTVKTKMEADLKWIAVPGVMQRCSRCDHQLIAFRFRIGLRNFNTVSNQKKVLIMIRSLTENYKTYNLTTYHSYWPWIEQYNSVIKMAALTICTSIVCMFMVASIFFQSAYCVFWTIFAVISIDVGVIGYMRFANVNLDFVSVCMIIMSIGLSVDYTAHIVHGFKIAEGNAIEKVRNALGCLGWPVLQGAFSTFAGVTPVLAVDYYIVAVFGKVTTLSIFFGMFHACVILPTVLCCSEELLVKLRRNKNSK